MLSSFLVVLAAASWKPLPAVGIPNLATIHAFGDTLLACGVGGCATSSDNGSSWQERRAVGATTLAPVFSGADGISSEGHAIHLTRDGGRTWKAWTEGIGSGKWVGNVDIRGDLAYASAHDYDYATNAGATPQTCNWYVRRLDAATWTRIDRKETNNDDCRNFKVGAGGRLFRTIDTLLPGRQYPDNVSQTSLDGGQTWESEDTNLTISRIGASQSLYLKRRYSEEGLLSLDSGRTWTVTSPAYCRPVVLDDAWRCSDTTAWQTISGNEPTNMSTDSLGSISSWARAGSRLWAVGAYGLFSSSDSGRSWRVPSTPVPLDAGVQLRWHAGALYGWVQSSQRNFVLLHSKDEGRSWTRLMDRVTSVDAFIPCGNDLLNAVTTVVRDGSNVDYRRETLRISADGTVATTGSVTCPQDVRWDTIAFVNSGSPSATARRTVKIPANRRVASKAMVDGGIFLILSFDDQRTLAFAPDGTDSAVASMELQGGSAALKETSDGALLTTSGRVYRCTAAKGCVPAPMPGTDSLWATEGFLANSNGFMFGFSYRHDANHLPDFSKFLLHASLDTGKSWTSVEFPSVPASATRVPSGFLLSTSGAGLWLLASDSFRVTGVSPTINARSATPSLRAHGRFLSISGAPAGVRLRVLDASGRVVLDVRPEVRDGRAQVALPSTPRGMLFAELAGNGIHTSARWVATDR